MQTPPPLKSDHLEIKEAQRAKTKDGRKISYYIAFGRNGRTKGAFWAIKNLIFFKSGQICREY